MPAKVTFAVEDVVGHITLDDGAENRFDRELFEQLEGALDAAEDALIRAVVIEGRPGVFSLGLDIAWMGQLGAVAGRRALREYGRVILRLFQFPRPVVAAIGGHAISGGLVLALACDVRVAAQGEYRYGLRKIAGGLAVPTFAVEIARAQLPNHVHMRTIGCGDVVDLATAHTWGMVDRVVDEGSVGHEALVEAERLGGLSNSAFATTKRALRRPTVAAATAREEEDIEAFLRESAFASERSPRPLELELEPPTSPL